MPLELDAAGIMVPHIMSLADAQNLVRMTRLHPLGRRPMDGGNADGRYAGIEIEDYIKQANRQRFVMIQIEDPVSGSELLRFHPANPVASTTFVTAGDHGLLAPSDIDFGPDGKFYVCSIYNNRIIRFNGLTGAYESEFVSMSNPICLLFGDSPPEPDISIDGAKKAAAGSPVETRNVIATAQFFTGSGTPNSFAVQKSERTAGIRFLSSIRVVPGDRLTIAGSALLLGGERVIDARSGAVTIR